MGFNKNKYKFISHDLSNGIKEVIALGQYRGRVVKGRSKCDPRDTFDEEFGKTYAALRCNCKIAEKRLENAAAECQRIEDILEKYSIEMEKAERYYADAEDKLGDARELLWEFEDKME